ncbi:hypothetical protein [Levilactobacillus tongjiangensis]|uniref:DUF4352 domain-containing protein n=1 Tax=Levilactobacillus tongjiangensis TaxID=2486023 RepID=A0ABW1STX6_9LACO|nr:hypothetical protein [Levilactobacillus tongjiangensis]
MKRNIVLISLALVSLGLGLATTSVTANAKTINYGSIARGSSYHGVFVRFKFNKRLSHVSNNPNTWNNVAVYDTQIKNRSKKSVRFYFSKLYFAPLDNDYSEDSTFHVNRPHKYVTVKPHHTKVVKNSFRDSENAMDSLYMPEFKNKHTVTYYSNNNTYLTIINSMHHASKGYGWHPTWKWSKH